MLVAGAGRTTRERLDEPGGTRRAGRSAGPLSARLGRKVLRPVVSVIAAAAAAAGGGLGSAAAAAEPPIQVRLVAPASLAAGGSGAVAVEMVLPPGWHVNGHHPLQSFLIPTSVYLTTSAGALAEVRYPEPVKKRFAFADEELAVYEGTVMFASQLTLPPSASGKIALDAAVSYQPCNETQCYPPTKKSLTAALFVDAAHAKK